MLKALTKLASFDTLQISLCGTCVLSVVRREPV